MSGVAIYLKAGKLEIIGRHQKVWVLPSIHHPGMHNPPYLPMDANFTLFQTDQVDEEVLFYEERLDPDTLFAERLGRSVLLYIKDDDYLPPATVRQAPLWPSLSRPWLAKKATKGRTG